MEERPFRAAYDAEPLGALAPVFFSKVETQNFLVLFRNIISVPRRNLHYHFPRLGNHRLAPQSRIELQIRRGVEPVRFIVFHGREIFRAFLHPDVASRARIITAAGVVQFDVVIERHIQHGLLFAVITP